ncbi:hypothetical protein [Faecalispora anaeroviscerum]|uniref:hypothetical protein n=1 Tax=Faecalispora anaeroviscerum TaxID=2991836 RepID=UPI0024BB7A82|nr:hypothetical protein [Faecalispora anaeroviscerum]
MPTKKVPVYFYYLNITVGILREDAPQPSIQDFINYFNNALSFTQRKLALNRKLNFPKDEKVVWLDSYHLINPELPGNFNIAFKSAKYNHIRNVINTETMIEKGTVKNKPDGDEEFTHFCIRYQNGRDNLICIHESNYYGISIGKIVYYLNDMLAKYRDSNNVPYSYTITSSIMPCDSFLDELRRMKRVSVLKVEVEREDLSDDFLHLAGRDDVKDTVEIVLKKISRNKYIPKSAVEDYYNDMQQENKIKRITAEGTNQSGPFRLDTELMKMKQSVSVDISEVTNEVNSDNFFEKAEELIIGLR